MDILFRLLTVHVLVDFVFQSKSGVEDKFKRGIRSGKLWLHVFLHFILTYLVIGDWHQWMIPLGLALSHLLIDLWKISTGRDDLLIFLIDQLLHVVMIVLAFAFYIGGSAFREGLLMWTWWTEPSFWIVGFAFLLVVWPVGFAISKATSSWRDEIESETSERDSLSRAGMFIGRFERALVLIFVLLGRMEAIGFLIAAKSILRFGDRHQANPRKNTEYVLIGTLMSFTISIIIGLGALALMQNL